VSQSLGRQLGLAPELPGQQATLILVVEACHVGARVAPHSRQDRDVLPSVDPVADRRGHDALR